MDFNGKVAMVTGAGAGLGKATAIRLARHGARVGLLDRDRDRIEQVAKEMANEQRETLVLHADIAEPGEIEAAVAELSERFGRYDLLYANAGINGVWAPIEKLAAEEFDETLHNNLRGTFLTIKHSVPRMKQTGGSIVICSSINGTTSFSNSGATAYGVSKAGLLAMGKMLALELAPSGIRVNIICPGRIRSDIKASQTKRDKQEVMYPAEYPAGNIPLTGGEPGLPEQIADLVCFLLSDKSGHITGTPVWIDGGQSLLVG